MCSTSVVCRDITGACINNVPISQVFCIVYVQCEISRVNFRLSLLHCFYCIVHQASAACRASEEEMEEEEVEVEEVKEVEEEDEE